MSAALFGSEFETASDTSELDLAIAERFSVAMGREKFGASGFNQDGPQAPPPQPAPANV